MNELLSGINEVPWGKLLGVYNLADGVPAALSVLATSSSGSALAAAANYLRDELEHQDSITQATPFATPFLIRLLNSPSVVATPEVLSLLELFYRAAECVFETEQINRAAINSPEKYRGEAATLWNNVADSDDAFDHERFSHEELFSWDCLVIRDIDNAHDSIRKLSMDPRTNVRLAADSLLKAMHRKDA